MIMYNVGGIYYYLHNDWVIITYSNLKRTGTGMFL